MNILIVANHYAICSARYMTDAFTRLGHTVKHVGKPMGRAIWGLTLPERYVWTPDSDVDLYCDNSDGWSVCGPEFDLIIVMDSDPTILDDVPNWAYHSVMSPVIVYGVDNHVRDYRRPYFDHYFLAHRNVSVMAWGVDHPFNKPYPDMTHLPCAYDPVYFTPSTIPYAEREYDVCMIGYMYPQRWDVANRLKAAGVKVLAGTGLVYESCAAAYQNSRISLCLSVAGDVAQRVFETAACGCVIVSDKCADFDLLKPPGIWLIENDPVAEIQAILADPDTAQNMAAQSTMWANNAHRWDNRAQVIVEWVERTQKGGE